MSSSKKVLKAWNSARSPRYIGCQEATRKTPLFNPKIRQQIDPDVYDTDIKPYVEAAELLRNVFSQASIASEYNIVEASKKYSKGEGKWTALLLRELGNKIDAYIEAVEADVLSTNQHLKALDRTAALKWHQKQVERQRLEGLLLRMQGDLIVLREQKNQAVGEWADDIIRSSQQKRLCDWDYIERLAGWQKKPSTTRLPLFKGCDPSTEERFQNTVFTTYGNKIAPYRWGTGQSVWCCTSGLWTSETYAKAAHLVPYGIGEVQATYLFGQPRNERGHLMIPENSISVSSEFGRYMEYGYIALVPVENSNDIRVVVLEPHKQDCRLCEFDGKLLSFQNNFRPAKEYLYFAFVTAVIHFYRSNSRERWLSLKQKLPRWRIPGIYPRASALMAMAQRFGRMPTEEALELLGLENNDDKESPDLQPSVQDNLVSDYFALWIDLEEMRREKARLAYYDIDSD